MKINSIILRGYKASGKTHIAENIANLFQEEKVLRINALETTLNATSRKIMKSNYDLIIIDDCINIQWICEINRLVNLKYFHDNEKKIKSVLYLTQDISFKKLEEFKIIECTYSLIF